MTDPTISKLVARLRELLSKAKLGSLSVTAPDRDPCCVTDEDISIDVYSESFVRGTATARLIAETLNALPTLLDALERGQGATVCPGCNGRAKRDRTHECEVCWGAGAIAHSTDGGKVEGDLRHYRQLVDALQRVGQAADLVCGTPIEDVPGLLLQRSTWLPIAECGELEDGWYNVWCVKPGYDCGEGQLMHAKRFANGEFVVAGMIYTAEDITHVHRMGPIRGPGEG